MSQEQAAAASSSADAAAHVRSDTDAAYLDGIWAKACALDELMTDLEGAAAAMAGLAQLVQQNRQDISDFVGTGLAHVAEDIVFHHLPGIREWGAELGDLVRHRLPDDPLVALERKLVAADLDQLCRASEGGQADGSKSPIDLLLDQISTTPVLSTAGVAVAVRCLIFFNMMDWADRFQSLSQSILRWASARTRADEMRGGVIDAS